MPPFEYRPYSNPLVGSLTQLLMAPGQIEAQRAQTVGNAWAGAANDIGQSVAAIPQQMQRMKMQGLQMADLKGQIDERNARAAEMQRSLAAQSAGEKAIQSAIDPTTGKVDYEKAASLWEQAGFPTQANAYRESVQKTRQTAQALDEGQQKIEAGKRQVQQGYVDHLAELGAAGLEKLKTDDPIHARDYAMGLVANAASHGLVSADDAKQMLMQTAQATPDQLAGIYQKLVDGSATVKERMVTDALKQSEIEKNLALAKKDAAPPKGPNSQEATFRLDGKDVKGDYIPGQNGQPGKYFYNGQDVTAKATTIPSASAIAINAGNLTDAAMDQAAHRYLETGILPPGFGTAGVLQKTAIMNRAAQLDPKAALARNQAIYKADTTNLTKLQTTEGTLSSFERAAGKNLDQFMAFADKVPDTGVPWVNQPIRSVNAKGLGSADQAAFNAARDVALREIARVTNDPKLSGALTDSARKEVLGLIPADATFAQIKRVVKVLKQDMANVHSGLNDEIAAVKAGIGQNPASAQAQKPNDPLGIR